MAISIVKDLKKYIPIFKQATKQGVNEAETSLRVGKFFEDALGYDIFEEVSKEHAIKDRFVDYAIKIKGKIAFLVEVKQAAVDLRERHIEQASNYAANSGLPWIVLTNGRQWQLYRLTFDEGIQSDLIWSANILEDDIKDVSDKIGLLHRKSVVKNEFERYYAKVKTLSPASIIQAIFQENTLRMIRSHLKKMTGISVDEEELVEGIKQMISDNIWKAVGTIKVKRPRKQPRVKKAVTPKGAVTLPAPVIPAAEKPDTEKAEDLPKDI